MDMRDLERKLAEAAEVAAVLRKSRQNGGAMNGSGSVKDVSPKAAADYEAMWKAISDTRDKIRDTDESIRSDVNEIIDDIERRLVALSPVVNQIVVSGDGENTQLGEIEGAQHHLFSVLAKAVNVRGRGGLRKNVFLRGPAGSGKSTAGFNLAQGMGLGFTYIGQTLMPHQIEGYVRQGDGVYQETPFVRAFRDGGVLMLEEVDAWSPQAVLVANPPLANGYMELPNGEFIQRHKDCVIIACANTWGTGATAEYVGRNKLDAAFLDRFGVKLSWGYDDGLERAAAGNDAVVDAVQICRMNAELEGLKVLITPRSSIDCADMVRQGFSMKEAFEMNFLSSLDNGQRKRVLRGVDFV